MACWSTGVLARKPITPPLQYSITPGRGDDEIQLFNLCGADRFKPSARVFGGGARGLHRQSGQESQFFSLRRKSCETNDLVIARYLPARASRVNEYASRLLIPMRYW